MSRSRIRLVLVLALAIVSGAGPANAQSGQAVPTAPPTGSVYVTTLPVGADVWCDGVYVGRSPAFVDALAPGRHAITATKTGWESHEADVTISAGQTQTSSVALQRLPGARTALTGKVALFGAKAVREVSVDGLVTRVATDGTLTVLTGPHMLVVHMDSGTAKRQVIVYPDMTTDVILRDSDSVVSATHIAVVAPASDFLPAAAYEFDATRVYIKYHHHEVSARIGVSTIRLDGDAVSYDAAPAFIDGKLYLPLELLKLLSEAPKTK